MNSPSTDSTPTPISLILIGDDYEKSMEAQVLLMRNERFIDGVQAIRTRYGVGEYEVEGDYYYTHEDLMEPLQGKEDAFEQEVHALAERIRYPGDWHEAVRLYALGYPPEGCLFAKETSRVVGYRHADYFEVRIYGNVPQGLLREAMKEAEGYMTPPATVSHRSVKRRYRQSKNIKIYDLKQSGLKHKEIARYLDRKGVHTNLTAEDTAKYYSAAKKSIEEILA